ncbi:MAG TPA: cytochrome c family protein [Caulobacteraceae bacterium]|jgi:cytochrome c|nr:cytochrome c family protein [Caulobacteraceae bacterium]
MRVVKAGGWLAMAAASALALAACGSGGSNSAASGNPPPATAPTPTLTDAQKTTLLAQLGPAYQNADLSNGEARFAVCRSCHTTSQGGDDMTGPNLWGIFGRRAGSHASFTYSDALKGAGWTWDAARIDQWITDPRAVLPGTKMTFIGMPSATDRRDLIAFLKLQTSPPPAG